MDCFSKSTCQSGNSGRLSVFFVVSKAKSRFTLDLFGQLFSLLSVFIIRINEIFIFFDEKTERLNLK